ncbi:hypothetical protein H6F42_01135 [Pseudanabaena sp. FACHB-1998]|uniref:hypothetical protein n=1 Tax=Pseudanabaena sp. FACHB-1998 TaxID=2692858 RepID=UPI001680FCAE|nr:hypothetical protein [Pseudanabaena sp. FACHB-1998]MBD2175519.1 hypothetical protein [Pseudanabaena sp. FACHB-1998]
MNQVTNSAFLYGGSTVSDSYKKHLASMWDTLERRIEIARTNHNAELLALLELEKSAIAPYQVKTIATPVNNFASAWQSLRNVLLPKAEIKVKQVCDRAGNQWWYAYNPLTGQSVYAETDNEMRLWIEQQAL